MLKIFAIPVSLYCAKLRIVLRHKNLKWEECLPPGGYGSDEYKRLVPAGSLPALQHHDLILGDSEAIAEYLNEYFPQPEMLPGSSNERAKIREQSRFHDTRLEPVLRSIFPHIATENRDEAFIASQWEALEEKLRQLEPLLPERRRVLTLGDCGYPITCAWISALASHFALPNILHERMQIYLLHLSEHDAVADELASYTPKLRDWLASK